VIKLFSIIDITALSLVAYLNFIDYSSTSTIVLLDSGKPNSSIIVSTEKGSSKVDKIGSYVELKDPNETPSKVKEMSKEELMRRFGKVINAMPPKPISYILYFQKGSTELTDKSKESLKKALKTIEERSPCSVDIIGHTDTVGSDAINKKVSLTRAKIVKAIIEQKALKILSLKAKGYGENDLLIQTSDNVDEARNRNVEIFIK